MNLGTTLVIARFDHPDAVKLNDIVQAEYVERYGDGDATPSTRRCSIRRTACT